jgi:cysteine desulfurase / selenocysteine lyase
MPAPDLTRYRSDFPITEQYAFLSHAAVSPLNKRISTALHEYAELGMHEPLTRLFPKIFSIMGDLRERIVRLINAASSDEIVLMPNTATGINTVAASLPLRPGDNVLVLDGDYPANIYPWQQLAYRGVLTKVVPQHQGGLDIERLVARIDRRTRVIALSTVMFATGFRNDLATVGQICKERGIYFAVDAIQSLGAFPMDVQALNIDFLAAGSQKWLLSTPGAGFLYVRKERLDELEPGAYVGAGSVVDSMNYLDYNLTLPPTADRFNLGTPNIAGALALQASIGLIQEVGVEAIAQQISVLVDALINDLTERGYELAASAAPEHRAGIVVAQMPDAPAVCARLEEAGIIATPRGAGVRFAPHFYNTQEEIARVGEVLGDRVTIVLAN